MRIRLISACVLSACLASAASAQPAPGTLPPLLVPVPPVTELPAPPKRNAIVINVQDRAPAPPAPAAAPKTSRPAAVTQTQGQGASAPVVALPAQPANPPPPGPLPGQPLGQPPVPPLTPPGPGALYDLYLPLSSPMPVPPAVASAAPRLPMLPVSYGPPPLGLAGRFWVDNEVLLWAIEGQHLPPLVTTSPPGTPTADAGVIGKPGTQSIYGPGSQNNAMRFGYRMTAGAWIDDAARFAVEAQFFMTAAGGNQFNAFSPGVPILAIPVTNAVTNAPAAEPIAVPGVANGSIHVATSTTGLLGAGIWLRENFTRTDDPCDSCHLCRRTGGCCGAGCDAGSAWYCRIDSLFGYRYLHLSDNLEIDDQVNAVAALNGLPAGATLQRTDIFHASNTFHGVDLGMTADFLNGPWTISTIAKVAVGFNDSSVDVAGFHSVGGVTSLGGLFAQPTNIGHFSHVMASAVPELDLRLAYSFSPNVKVYAGYTFLYWYHVARAANQINPLIDPAFLTSGTSAVPVTRQPSPMFEDRSIWIQGLNVGFEWRY